MLSVFEQRTVWGILMGAEIRALYFAELSNRFQRRQRLLVLGSLVLSGGAFLSLVTTVIPAQSQWNWIKAALALFSAILSAWSLVAKNERSSIDAQDLHFRWNVLALEYRRLWSDVYSDGAHSKLVALEDQEALLSKSSTTMPNDVRLMKKCQANVEMHHRDESPAAPEPITA